MRKRHAPQRDEHDKRPGWVRDREAGLRLNRQQQVAEKTHGWVRLPNAMTFGGLALVGVGAALVGKRQYGKALAAFMAGYSLDMEGTVARRYGVDDPGFGGIADQVNDAVKAFVVSTSLTQHKVMPAAVCALTYGPKFMNAGVGVYSKARTGEWMASSDGGKEAEFVRPVIPALFLVGAKLEQNGETAKANLVRGFGWAAAVATFALGIRATIGYLHSINAEK